ncbi:hypothetical protein CmeUKMEL1_02985 [Cryptosporidium meleagridis]|uniref:Uncharacterized protein n=1 Tax=Cryptosporidium meleagridis TaxID=93969 RepID=A0A2P4YXY7_9CRYT|nr:hypothetical protein CmeUKMEL1_02985 [Cryptosporidium meleagridis]
MNNLTNNMLIKLIHKTTKYIFIYMIFVLFSKELEDNNHKISFDSNLSLIKILNSFENLQVDQIENPKDLKLVIDAEDINQLDISEKNNSTYVSDKAEAHLEAENNGTNGKIYVPKIQLLSEEVNSVSISQTSSSEIESPKSNQDEVEKPEVSNNFSKEDLENDISKLTKKEKKLLKELEKIEFIVNLYSKAFLSNSSITNTIKYIKKYEFLKKCHQENLELLSKKKAELNEYQKIVSKTGI